MSDVWVFVLFNNVRSQYWHSVLKYIWLTGTYLHWRQMFLITSFLPTYQPLLRTMLFMQKIQNKNAQMSNTCRLILHIFCIYLYLSFIKMSNTDMVWADIWADIVWAAYLEDKCSSTTSSSTAHMIVIPCNNTMVTDLAGLGILLICLKHIRATVSGGIDIEASLKHRRATVSGGIDTESIFKHIRAVVSGGIDIESSLKHIRAMVSVGIDIEASLKHIRAMVSVGIDIESSLTDLHHHCKCNVIDTALLRPCHWNIPVLSAMLFV